MSKPVRDLPAAAGDSTARGQSTDTGGTVATEASTGDGAMQTEAPAFGPSDDLTAPLTSFPGLRGGGPPDPVGDVGPNHYVQMINSRFQVFNKDGTTATGGAARNINTIWTSNAVNDNGCDTQNAGDPIVLYDQTVDRWMLSQFTSPNTAPFDMCIAYSQTPDPTGAYHTYSFRLDASHDYMKFGIWPDGLYMSTFEGGTLGAYAFDRAAMVSGSPATFQYFGSGASALGAGVSAAGRVRMFPSDWDGLNQPVVGEPNHFLLSKDSGNGQGGTQDVLEMYDFHVDWTNPANSTFGLASSLPTVPFDTQLSCANTFADTVARECVPQQGTTIEIDALPGRLMHRVQYRNLGTHRSMVVVQSSVDADGADKVGSRWYELRNTGAGWSIYQQGTYAPGSAHRWMGSAALDGQGNIAMGYSYSDPTNAVFPSLAYTGRLANAPLGSMPETEQRLVTGTSSQTGLARWGDYSSMNVDPVDDCTFWYTGQFNGDLSTQIGSFRFDSCNATDLRISKTDAPDPVLAGQVLTYTMTVTNDGPVTADAVVVTDVLPAGVTFLSSTAGLHERRWDADLPAGVAARRAEPQPGRPGEGAGGLPRLLTQQGPDQHRLRGGSPEPAHPASPKIAQGSATPSLSTDILKPSTPGCDPTVRPSKCRRQHGFSGRGRRALPSPDVLLRHVRVVRCAHRGQGARTREQKRRSGGLAGRARGGSAATPHVIAPARV